MEIIDRIIGIWMMGSGIGLFVFAHMIAPYIEIFSGATYFAVAIPASIFLGVSTGVLIGFGIAQTVGAITILIRVEGGK